MADRDLTPDEARAEVEAFMGEGWELYLYGPCATDPQVVVRSWRGSVVVTGYAPTYRAAVDALKTAWRDAVRPWCLNTMELATDCVVSWESSSGDCWEYQDEFSKKIGADGIVARVLKEDQ